MNVFQISLPAGQRVQTSIAGNFFLLVDADDLDVEFIGANGTKSEKGSNVSAGYKRHPGGGAWSHSDPLFAGFVLSSATTQTVTVAVSMEAGDYQQFLTTVAVEKPNTITTTADATVSSTAVQIAASNANRKSLIVQNVDAADTCRVGDSNVTASRGVRLQPGQSVVFESTAAIYAIREAAADVTVAVLEESRT